MATDQHKNNVSLKHKSSYLFASIQTIDDIPDLITIEKNLIYCSLHDYSEIKDSYQHAGLIIIHHSQITRLLEYASLPQSLLYKLRNLPELKSIAGIESLDCSKYILSYLFDFLLFDHDHFIILNIEPKSLSPKTIHLYPHASITLPGGHVEEQDQGKFISCAIREFQEETKLQIKSYEVNAQILFQKPYFVKPFQQRKIVSAFLDPHIEELSDDTNLMSSYVFITKIKLYSV